MCEKIAIYWSEKVKRIFFLNYLTLTYVSFFSFLPFFPWICFLFFFCPLLFYMKKNPVNRKFLNLFVVYSWQQIKVEMEIWIVFFGEKNVLPSIIQQWWMICLNFNTDPVWYGRENKFFDRSIKWIWWCQFFFVWSNNSFLNSLNHRD